MSNIREETLSLKIDSTGAATGARTFTGATTAVQGGATKAAVAVAGLAKNLGGLYLAYKTLGTIKQSVRDFAAFERQMANVSTMLYRDGAMKYLPAYKQQIRELALEFGEGTETLSKGLYDILSASIDASKAMDVLTVSSRAAQAGLTTTAVAGDAITTILNSYGLSADYAGKVSSDLFETVQRGKLVFGDLASEIGLVAADAASAGVSLEELLAAVATLTRGGLRAPLAVTSLRALINAFRKPSEEGKKAAAELGFEMNVTTLHAQQLSGMLRILAKASNEQLAAIFQNVRGLTGLAVALEQAGGVAEDVGYIMESSGADLEAYSKMADTAAKQFERYHEAMKDVRVTIGEAFAPALARGSKAMADFVKDNQRFLERLASDFEEGAEFTAGVIWDAFELMAQAPAAFLEKLEQVKKALDILPSSARMPIVDPTDPLGGSARGDYGWADQMIRDAAAGNAGPVDFGPLLSRANKPNKRTKPTFTPPGGPTVETGMPTYGRRVREEGLIGGEGAEELSESTLDARDKVDRLNAELVKEMQIIGHLEHSHERAAKMVEYEAAVMEAYGNGTAEARARLAEYNEELDRLEKRKRLVELGEQFGDTWGRAFEDIAVGAQDARQALDALWRDVARMILRQQITEPLSRSISRAFVDYFGGTPAASDVPMGAADISYQTPVAHSGWRVGTMPPSVRDVPWSVFAGAPRLHNGLRWDEYPAILQKDEVVTSAADARAGRNVTLPQPVFNIQNQSSAQVEAQQTGVQFDGRRMIVGMVLKDKRNNGPMARANRRR
ncbi:MAG TPA: phage tail tape measure protein [Phycisphaerae bacterium]|mgnify:CR=1 FL=1|nr:phage tail tape measure protein [Phycisphaerae bacterium]